MVVSSRFQGSLGICCLSILTFTKSFLLRVVDFTINFIAKLIILHGFRFRWFFPSSIVRWFDRHLRRIDPLGKWWSLSFPGFSCFNPQARNTTVSLCINSTSRVIQSQNFRSFLTALARSLTAAFVHRRHYISSLPEINVSYLSGNSWIKGSAWAIFATALNLFIRCFRVSPAKTSLRRSYLKDTLFCKTILTLILNAAKSQARNYSLSPQRDTTVNYIVQTGINWTSVDFALPVPGWWSRLPLRIQFVSWHYFQCQFRLIICVTQEQAFFKDNWTIFWLLSMAMPDFSSRFLHPKISPPAVRKYEQSESEPKAMTSSSNSSKILAIVWLNMLTSSLSSSCWLKRSVGYRTRYNSNMQLYDRELHQRHIERDDSLC